MAKQQDEHRKYFNKDGKEVPSCTTIIKMLNKPELVKWANYMGFKKINTTSYLEERAAIGTNCHSLFELYFTGGILCANGHTEFLNKEEYRMVIYKFRMIELYFQKLGMIFDLKTSKEAYQSHWVQLMGYVQLVEEVYNLPVEEVGIILLSKPLRSPELINIRKTKDCWRELTIFNKLRDIYYFMNSTDEEILSSLK